MSPVFSPCRSLDRKLQRPLLGKSRTLPSIPQSPVLSRIPLLDSAAFREAMPEQKPYQKHSAPDGQKGCTVPSAGECTGVCKPLSNAAWFSRVTANQANPSAAPYGVVLLPDLPFSMIFLPAHL